MPPPLATGRRQATTVVVAYIVVLTLLVVAAPNAGVCALPRANFPYEAAAIPSARASRPAGSHGSSAVVVASDIARAEQLSMRGDTHAANKLLAKWTSNLDIGVDLRCSALLVDFWGIVANSVPGRTNVAAKLGILSQLAELDALDSLWDTKHAAAAQPPQSKNPPATPGLVKNGTSSGNKGRTCLLYTSPSPRDRG